MAELESPESAVTRPRPEHAVQLFDNPDSVAETVATFVSSSLDSNATVLILISSENWRATARNLGSREADRAIAHGRLTVLNAAVTLSGFMQGGGVRGDWFDRTVTPLVDRLAAQGRPLRIYGEMVDVLAAEGDFRSALQLETLWNELALRTHFTLLCGYSAVSFGDPRVAHALQRICRAHTHVRTTPRDPLATFLLESSPRQVSPLVGN